MERRGEEFKVEKGGDDKGMGGEMRGGEMRE
jgi:hypothetical protein